LSWFWLVIASMVGMAFANLVDRIAVSRIFRHSTTFSFFVGAVNFILGLATLAVFPFRGSAEQAAFVFAAGVVVGCATLCYYKAMSKGEATRLAPFFNLFPLFTLLFATLFLGEKLSATQTLGVFLAVAGAFAVTVKDFKKLAFETGAGIMLAAAIFWGASEVMQKNALAALSFWNVWSVIGLGLFATVLPTLLRRETREEVFETLTNKKIAVPLVNETVYFVGNLALTAAFSMSLVSIISAAESIKLAFLFVFALVASRFFPKLFKEELGGRVLAQKIAATALIAVGVYLAAF